MLQCSQRECMGNNRGPKEQWSREPYLSGTSHLVRTDTQFQGQTVIPVPGRSQSHAGSKLLIYSIDYGITPSSWLQTTEMNSSYLSRIDSEWKVI